MNILGIADILNIVDVGDIVDICRYSTAPIFMDTDPPSTLLGGRYVGVHEYPILVRIVYIVGIGCPPPGPAVASEPILF